ncbi:MAG: hypothetical protein LLF96_06580 [Eubacteriales bacterium]|nr:hypothetical protein [Eubacteriales bacterium]
MKRKERGRKPDPGDDGRIIAPMNVDGMPWHTTEKTEPEAKAPAEPMTRREMHRYMFSAVGAGLLIVLVFGLAGAAFILFLTQVVFR